MGRLNRDRWHNGGLDIAAAPGGRVFAAWTEYDGRLWIARSGDGGRTFCKPLLLAGDPPAPPASAMALALGADHAMVLAWTTRDDDAAMNRRPRVNRICPTQTGCGHSSWDIEWPLGPEADFYVVDPRVELACPTANAVHALEICDPARRLESASSIVGCPRSGAGACIPIQTESAGRITLAGLSAGALFARRAPDLPQKPVGQ